MLLESTWPEVNLNNYFYLVNFSFCDESSVIPFDLQSFFSKLTLESSVFLTFGSCFCCCCCLHWWQSDCLVRNREDDGALNLWSQVLSLSFYECCWVLLMLFAILRSGSSSVCFLMCLICVDFRSFSKAFLFYESMIASSLCGFLIGCSVQVLSLLVLTLFYI